VADEEVVIVEDDGSQSAQSEPLEERDESLKEESRSDKIKKALKKFIVPVVAITLISVAVILIIIFRPKSEKVEINATEAAHITPAEKPKITAGELERLIEKAKALYQSGDKESALKLYEQISLYSESVSNYNLGVAKMGEGDYAGALKFFQNSIKSDDNELPSAINAAVCLFREGKNREANEYISLAKSSLPRYVNSPLYSYYYALVNYYEGNYYEALCAANAPTGKFYKPETNEIAKRAYLLFDSPAKALEVLKEEKSREYLTIGYLQAREGSFKEAIDSLEKAKRDEKDRLNALMAQALVYLKAKLPSQSAIAIKDAMVISEQNASSIFGVDVFLRESAFESDKIQNKILNEFLFDKKNSASILFYFAPYKLFNPNKTVSSIKKGEAGLLVDDVKAGVAYLENAAKQSKINAQMVRGIEYAVNGRIFLANRAFKELEPKYPTHAVLLYNLALTYAQSGDFKEANRYFIKAYNFDPKNYDAGIFAILTSKIMGADFERTKDSLESDLFSGGSFANKEEYAAMLSYALDNSVAAIDWLMNTKKPNASALAAGILISLKLDKRESANSFAKELAKMLPDDIVAGGLNLFVSESAGDVKSFAKMTQNYLSSAKYNINTVFYGPDIAKDIYISLHRASGLISRTKPIFENRLSIERVDRAQLLKGYATALMYLKMFREANGAFSTVILNMDYINAHTLFMAGASAIASGKNSDAISYFELAKLYDPTSVESIYALGLLYLEAANLNQATTQFKQIGGQFESEFFDFDIK